MRKQRIKFKDISISDDYIGVLRDTLESLQLTASSVNTKIKNGDFVLKEHGELALTKNDLTERLKAIEEAIESTEDDIIDAKVFKNELILERDKKLSVYRSEAVLIQFKVKENDIRTVEINNESIELLVSKIYFYLNTKNDMLNFAVLFYDGSVIFKSTHIDNIIKVVRLR